MRKKLLITLNGKVSADLTNLLLGMINFEPIKRPNAKEIL